MRFIQTVWILKNAGHPIGNKILLLDLESVFPKLLSKLYLYKSHN